MSRIYERAGARASEPGLSTVRFQGRPHTMRSSMRETREAQAERTEIRPDINPMDLVNPPNLVTPPARSGYVQRWIDFGERPDGAMNVQYAKKIHAGWAPRDPATIPEKYRRAFQTVKSKSGEDLIRAGGLVLCELPRQVAMERKHAVEELIKRQRRSMYPGLGDLKNGEARKNRYVTDIHPEVSESVATGRRAATMLE